MTLPPIAFAVAMLPLEPCWHRCVRLRERPRCPLSPPTPAAPRSSESRAATSLARFSEDAVSRRRRKLLDRK